MPPALGIYACANDSWDHTAGYNPSTVSRLTHQNCCAQQQYQPEGAKHQEACCLLPYANPNCCARWHLKTHSPMRQLTNTTDPKVHSNPFIHKPSFPCTMMHNDAPGMHISRQNTQKQTQHGKLVEHSYQPATGTKMSKAHSHMSNHTHLLPAAW